MGARRPTSGVDSVLPRRLQGSAGASFAGGGPATPRRYASSGVDSVRPRRLQVSEIEQDIERIAGGGGSALPKRPYPGGTTVRLPDGSVGVATPDQGVGRPWSGKYRVQQGGRVDYWFHDQITPVR